MRPFAALTRRGRARRLLPLAAQVLASAYQLDGAAVRPLAAHSFNTMFLAEPTDGRRLVLRVGDAHRIHAAGVEEVEAAWLAALMAEAPALAGPVNIGDRRGRPWTTAQRGDVPGERMCSLFSWVRGRRLLERLDAASMVAAGRLMAGLHEHAASLAVPVPIPPGVVADRVVYFEDPSLIFGYRSPHGDLFVEAIARVQEHIDRLWAEPPHRPHLLHGDFGPQNVLRWRDEVRPIDFQDLLFGFDVQDLGITVTDLEQRSPELIEPFRLGYAQVRPWPAIEPELQAAFAAARSLNVMNLGLNLRRPGVADFLDEHSRRVLEWMRSAT
jgi:Ser/Thr protein kinase RdoA (MazF antagonist)